MFDTGASNQSSNGSGADVGPARSVAATAVLNRA